MLLDNNGNPLVAVYVCWSDTEASVIAALLKSHGISAVSNSKVPHSVWPITADGLGEVQVLVEQDDADPAREIIQESASQDEIS